MCVCVSVWIRAPLHSVRCVVMADLKDFTLYTLIASLIQSLFFFFCFFFLLAEGETETECIMQRTQRDMINKKSSLNANQDVNRVGGGTKSLESLKCDKWLCNVLLCCAEYCRCTTGEP